MFNSVLKYLFFLTSFILIFSFARSQQWENSKIKIIGKVIDSKNNIPVEYATIALFNTLDSSLIAGTITDAKGQFLIEASLPSDFAIKIDFIGYKEKTIKKPEISQSQINLGLIKLEAATTTLEAIEVESEKSQYQIGIDKKVFNVGKDLSTTGGSATDILQNIPSVSVDMDGGVSLRGSDNIKILIDGKPSGLTGISRADVLQQIPASSIESIEIITNPSAKYDSEGMGGIINIVLKKQRQKGFNGLFTISAGTGDKYNGSMNINYNTGRINFFLNYDARLNNSESFGLTNRKATINDTVSYLDQNEESERTKFSNNIRLGCDYKINNKNTISLSALYRKAKGDDNTFIEYTEYDSEKVLTSFFTRDNNVNEDEYSIDYSLNYQKNFSGKDHLLNVDFLYFNGNEEELNDVIQQSYAPDFSVTYNPLLEQVATNDKQYTAVVQANYTHPFKKGKIETGLKSNLRNIDADFSLEAYNDSLASWLLDTNVSNRFIYDEQVHAAYALYNNVYKGINYKIGARLEQTLTNSTLENTGVTYNNEYLDVFPSIHLSKDIKNKDQFQLSYTRRINRPSFWSLNPFNEYEDPLNVRRGNPYLKPEYINSFDFTHIKYWSKISLSTGLYYRTTMGVIQRIRTLQDDGVSITSFENFSGRINYGIELSCNVELKSWWNFLISGNYYRNIINGENIMSDFTSDSYSWNTRLNNNFTVQKDIDIQLIVNYRAPMEWPQGKVRAMYFADLGIKKDIMKKKGTLSLRVSDLFNTQKFIIDIYGSNYYTYLERKRDSQNIFLSFTYRLNSYKQKEKRREELNNNSEEMDF